MSFLLMIFLTLVCLFEDYPAPPWAGRARARRPADLAGRPPRRRPRLLGVAPRQLAAGPRPVPARRPAARLRARPLLCISSSSSAPSCSSWPSSAGAGPCRRPGKRRAAGPLPGLEVLLLLPFLLVQLLHLAVLLRRRPRRPPRRPPRRSRPTPFGQAWLEARPAARPLPFGGRWTYVAFQAPPEARPGLHPGAAAHRPEGARPAAARHRGRDLAAACSSLLGIVACWPSSSACRCIIRLVLGLQPLPDGPIRDRLLAAAKRLGFRCQRHPAVEHAQRHGQRHGHRPGAVAALRRVHRPAAGGVHRGRGRGGVRPRGRPRPPPAHAVLPALPDRQHGGAGAAGRPLPPAAAGRGVGGAGRVAAVACRRRWRELLGPARRPVAVPGGGAAAGRTSSWCSASCRGAASGRRTCSAAGRCRAAPGLPRARRGDGAAPSGRGPVPDRHPDVHPALEKVALVNGISRDRPGFLQSWQHSTIARRVAFLDRVLLDRAAEPRFQRRLWWSSGG